MAKTRTVLMTPKVAPGEVKKTTPKAPVVAKKALYAVFTTGGKQYRVGVGDLLKIEKLSDPSTGSGQANYKEGDKLVFDKVLLVDDGTSEATIGTPYIKGAVVNATLNKIARYPTIDVIQYKQKSRYFKKYGHRQPYFEIKIDSIK